MKASNWIDTGVFELHHEMRLVPVGRGLCAYCTCGWAATRSVDAQGAASDWAEHMSGIEKLLTANMEDTDGT